LKLTEDDFEVINYYRSKKNDIRCSQQSMEQILKNQEDAEKWNSKWPDRYSMGYLYDCVKTVERLKKLDKKDIFYPEKVQKILGEKID